MEVEEFVGVSVKLPVDRKMELEKLAKETGNIGLAGMIRMILFSYLDDQKAKVA